MNLYSADQQTLAAFFEVVGAGVVVFEVRAQREVAVLCTNSAFRAMYGLDGSPSLPSPLGDVFDKHARQCAAQLTPTDFEHPLADGEQWLRVRMIPAFAAQEDEAVRIFATAMDITAKRRLERALQLAHARLSAIIDSSFEGIITADTDQQIRTINQAACRIFGYREDEVIDQPLTMLIPERFRAQHPSYVHQFQASDDHARPMESRVEVSGRRKDGSEFMAEVTIAKIGVGSRTEFTAFIRDISEHMRLLDELYLRASTDPLTGLHNRRHMTEEAEKELTRAQRFSHPTTAILIDLDDFKRINDTHGHQTGDQVLRQAAKICRRQVRRSDIIARWGGEEFLLLLPETDMTGAARMAERIQNELHGLRNSLPELEGQPVTASIGIAMFQGKGDGFEAMVHRADEAMYTAKHSGKDRIVTAD